MGQSSQQTTALVIATAAMVVVVAASNYLVQFPVNDFLTYGAFTYPVAFLVTDLCNRSFGPALARKVIYAGFLVAVIASIYLADLRIALASGSAFLCAQLLDIVIFNRLRQGAWWQAPFISSTVASALDTLIFFSLAFACPSFLTDDLGCTTLPWVTWALGDYLIKMAVTLVMLLPFRIFMTWLPQADKSGD
ncbi:VUT family protein [Rhodovibrionaceae bacterium A322]